MGDIQKTASHRGPALSVLIATYNRAADLKETLESIAAIQTAHTWEAIVIDNNSGDDTARVVDEAERVFPVNLRYVFAPEQGKAAALNAGIRVARGEILAFTDDDVRVAPDWLDRAFEGLQRFGCDYVGGKALPIWSAPRPDWIPDRGGTHWAVLALLDYGNEAFEFGPRVPLGVNLVIRASAFSDQRLWWDNAYDRKGGSLRGQGQREWCLRATRQGLRGFYIPTMVVHHKVPGERLNKNYFRRWMYWKGVSRAILYTQTGRDMEAPEMSRLDYSTVPHILGVPRYMYKTFLKSVAAMVRGWVRRDRVAAFDREMWLWFFAGVLHQRMGRRTKDRS